MLKEHKGKLTPQYCGGSAKPNMLVGRNDPGVPFSVGGAPQIWSRIYLSDILQKQVKKQKYIEVIYISLDVRANKK